MRDAPEIDDQIKFCFCGIRKIAKKHGVVSCSVSLFLVECEVGHVLCQHHVRRRPMCFCVGGCCSDMFIVHGMGMVTSYVLTRPSFRTVCFFSFLLVSIGVVCAFTHTIFHAGGCGRHTKHSALTTSREHGHSSAALLLLSSIPPSFSPPPKENRMLP